MGNLAHRGERAAGQRPQARFLGLGQRDLRHAPNAPGHGGERQQRPDEEGRHGHLRDVVVPHGVAVHAQHHQDAGREVGQGLRQAGEGTLCEEAQRMLLGAEPVADIG
ncbi:MAG: hypothetical protein ACK55I_07815, partial [bacterium]